MAVSHKEPGCSKVDCKAAQEREHSKQSVGRDGSVTRWTCYWKALRVLFWVKLPRAVVDSSLFVLQRGFHSQDDVRK